MGADHFGHIDIEYDEIMKYMKVIEKKKEVCKIMPSLRLSVTSNGLKYDGLVCSPKMEGEQTGISAEWCKNCILKEEEH